MLEGLFRSIPWKKKPNSHKFQPTAAWWYTEDAGKAKTPMSSRVYQYKTFIKNRDEAFKKSLGK